MKWSVVLLTGFVVWVAVGGKNRSAADEERAVSGVVVRLSVERGASSCRSGCSSPVLNR